MYNGYLQTEEIGEHGDKMFYNYSQSDFKRLKNAFNINFGTIIYFGSAKKVGVIPKFGLGLKKVHTKFSNAENLEEDDLGGLPMIHNRYFKEGDVVEQNLNVQIKFFYKF